MRARPRRSATPAARAGLVVTHILATRLQRLCQRLRRAPAPDALEQAFLVWQDQAFRGPRDGSIALRDEKSEELFAAIAGNIVGWGGPWSYTFTGTRQDNLSLFQEQMNDAVAANGGEPLMNMTPAELRVAINKYMDQGVDFVKYGGTSHAFFPAMIGFSEAAQKALVEEVHKRGMVAETHSTSPEGLRVVVWTVQTQRLYRWLSPPLPT